MSRNIVIPTGKRLGIPALLFEEDFESPVVSGYSNGTLPTGWLIADTGFGSGSIGLNNEDSGDWTSPGTSDEQGLDPNYTNSGACTDSGVIGTIDINSVTYRLTVTIAYDKATSGKTGAAGGSASGDYDVMLCALEGGFDRQDWAAGSSNFDSRAIVTLSGSVSDDDKVHTFSGEYTTNSTTDAGKSGYDLAVGIDGATSHAIVTYVKVEIIP